MPFARSLPTVIGPTENALRALLTKILSSTSIKTYPAWVILNAAGNSDSDAPSEGWRRAVSDALKLGPDGVEEILARLRIAGLVDSDGLLTAQGTAELTAGRSAVSKATSRLVEGIGEEEQATACMVLDQVRRKAEELLGL